MKFKSSQGKFLGCFYYATATASRCFFAKRADDFSIFPFHFLLQPFFETPKTGVKSSKAFWGLAAACAAILGGDYLTVIVRDRKGCASEV